MPTGYTAELQENTEMPFEEFVWKCARGMGVCIMQRDDPANAPIVLEEKPSDHHAEGVQEAEKGLAILRGQSPDEIKGCWRRDTEKRITDAHKSIAETAKLRRSYERMLALVEDWTPPTDDHKKFQDFMLEQLRGSIVMDCRNSYARKQIDQAPETPEEWAAAREVRLLHDIEYHFQHLAEEQERVSRRNRWKQQLVESIGLPTCSGDDA